MAWLKWVIGLQDRPEVLLIAEKTSKEPELVAALCMVAWAWADTEGHDGIVAGATLTMLDLVTKKAPGFGSAMAETPWLKATADGLHFTGWETHNSQSAKDRALDQKRKAETNRTETGRRPETIRTETGPEKRREENITTTPPTPPRGGLKKKKNWGNDVPFSQRPENQNL